MYIHFVSLNNAQEPDFIQERKHGIIDFLFLRFHAKTTLMLGDKTYTLTKPCMFLIDSYTPYKYFSNSENYTDDYLHFSTENRQQFLIELTFPLNTPIYIANDSSISQLLHLIYKCQMEE